MINKSAICHAEDSTWASSLTLKNHMGYVWIVLKPQISPKPAEIGYTSLICSPDLGFNQCSMTLRSLPTSQPPKCYVCISILSTLPVRRCIILTQWNTFDQWSPLPNLLKNGLYMSLTATILLEFLKFLKTAILKYKTFIRKQCEKFIMYMHVHMTLYTFISTEYFLLYFQRLKTDCGIHSFTETDKAEIHKIQF